MEKYTIVIKSEYFTSEAILEWNQEQETFVCVAASPIIKFFIGRSVSKIKGYCSDRNWKIEINKDIQSNETSQCIG